MTLVAHTRARVWGTKNHWSLAPHPGLGRRGRDCEFDLQIQGDEKGGYNLVMSPAGFFTADEWYESKDDVLAVASELFGLDRESWKTKHEGNSS